MEYVLWYSEDRGNSCAILKPQRVPRSFELTGGIPRAKDWPDDVFSKMDPDYPQNIKLEDSLINTDDLIVSSRPLKEFLEGRGVPCVEYLPITIMNHKDRVASKDYFIIHPVGLQEGLDVDKSGCEWSLIDSDTIDDVEQIVIRPSKIDPNVPLFRLKYYYYPIFVRSDLAEAIINAGFTGIGWDKRVEISD